jgi:hypothetical protein
MKLDDLIEKYKEVLWRHYKERKLFATMKNPGDQPRFPDDLPFDKEIIDAIQAGTMQYEDLWKTNGRYEENGNVYDEVKKRIIGGRPQIDTVGTSIKKYIKEGKTIPSPAEYLKAIQTEPIYQNESGMTPEDHIIYAITHLEETNQVIDDYQGNDSASCQVGAYFPDFGHVPYAYWNRYSRRVFLSGDFPGNRYPDPGIRTGVRI